MTDIILKAEHLKKVFISGKKSMTAVDDVSFELQRGECLGIVGESGSGKSTIAKMITHLEPVTGGQIFLDEKNITNAKGKELRDIYQDMQMVFQMPMESFDPRRTLGDGIGESLRNMGISRRETRERVENLLEKCGLEKEFADRYPHNMSGGQRQRVGIARAIALEPEIIFCDESTSALDVSIQKAILELLVKLQKEKNIAIGFICHDLAMISSIAHQIAVMYMGNIVEILPGEEVARGALHPYTKALLQSVFDLHMDFNKPITPLEGEASMPTGELQGCPFQNRCAFCMEKCQKEKPELKTLDENHQIACWRI